LLEQLQRMDYIRIPKQALHYTPRERRDIGHLWRRWETETRTGRFPVPSSDDDHLVRNSETDLRQVLKKLYFLKRLPGRKIYFPVIVLLCDVRQALAY